MTEYIEREAVKDKILSWAVCINHPELLSKEDTIYCIDSIPAAKWEQVEKWRGEWEWYDEEVGAPLEGIEREWGWRCSKCKVVLPDDFDDPDNPPAMRFCQWCGAPMTDEAVQMVMERMEALHGNL